MQIMNLTFVIFHPAGVFIDRDMYTEKTDSSVSSLISKELK